MAHVRLVVVDLDGTLLDSAKRISSRDERAIRGLAGSGVSFAIATGRRFAAVSHYVDALKLAEPAWVISNSGAFVRRGVDGPILRRRLFDRTLAARALQVAHEHRVTPLVHDGPEACEMLLVDQVGRTDPEPILERYLGAGQHGLTTVDALPANRDPVQLTFAASIAANRGLDQSLRQDLAERILTRRTEYTNPPELSLLDVLHPQASKRAAVLWLMHALRVEVEELLVIGDNWNDLDMLELAAEGGQAIVMANATSELRQRFEATASNDASGVARALEERVLKKGTAR